MTTYALSGADVSSCPCCGAEGVRDLVTDLSRDEARRILRASGVLSFETYVSNWTGARAADIELRQLPNRDLLKGPLAEAHRRIVGWRLLIRR